ncbi:delta-1-pyrroline-5-carboxylate synthase isoform X2 [Cryptomeria japonica]|nr:delta-1-pyrroline-5-carboxylate synthase isoform X2 [Cryptomeria japonica]
MSLGLEVILVTSGAVGIGRQRLRYQRLINSSFVDLQKPQVELDGKPCAAVGQSGLMAIYDSLFSQLDVASSQLLVTDNEFKDSDFRKQLSETVGSLLELRVVPIFNENDAVSTRKAPYKDATGIFWDNDSLAALLALELRADLLILLSDVEGLYSGPPTDPRSKLIRTYLKEEHDETITFGDKSRVGRGGMTAKVKAACHAAEAGIPVVITSGFTADGILRVLQGQRVGTLFHREAHLWHSVQIKEHSARKMAVSARDASRVLQGFSSVDRRKILLDVADALEANEECIRKENEIDVYIAKETRISEALISRLTLKPGKISDLAKSLRVLADINDPIGQVVKRTEISDGLILEKTTCPLGVLLIIFESRPDALVQIASLAIRSGNGLLLKGGKEAARSNAILHKVISEALPKSVGPELIGLVTSRDEIPDLLKLDDVIDLVIPRGSNKLVSEIKESTKIPVLGHADGVCHVYVDKAADLDMAKRIVLDAKTDYPAVCNAMETLLVHEALMKTGGLNELILALETAGVRLYGGTKASDLLKLPKAISFHHEYSSMACTVEIVKDVLEAINHIHEHGSAHTDCIVTEDRDVADVFLRQVDSAAVFHNASTRFCDGARFGLGAEVGISTSRIHARGPVGVEGLLTTRWLLRGTGQVVNGDHRITYTHKDLPVNYRKEASKNLDVANGDSVVVPSSHTDLANGCNLKT